MADGIDRSALIFDAERSLKVVEESLPAPADDQVLVKTHLSAISAGSELLVYRGQAPQGLQADEVLPALSGSLAFPIRYGYAAVGSVVACGPDVESAWNGRRVFSFHPHASHFLAATGELAPLPQDLPDEEAIFLPNMETALHLVHEGRPLARERVVVLGQGVVGLLTTALLARHPLESLVTLDQHPLRRVASMKLGAAACLDPSEADAQPRAQALLTDAQEPDGADLLFEVSGNPAGLDLAIGLAGYGARIVIGSWYGARPVQADLGGRFHRSNLRLISSQVSRIQPELSGRWTKSRRLAAAIDLLGAIRPSQLITHRFDLDQASEAYSLLDQRPQDALQVVFRYDG